MKILLVHQGAELYGSDRTFIQSVKAFYDAGVDVSVLLPEPGPLVAEIQPFCSNISFSRLFVLRKGLIFKFSYWLGFFTAFYGALRKMRGYDIVYVNTIVIFDYMMACRFSSAKSFIHVHEIPGRRIGVLFRWAISFSGARIIYNSNATKNALFLHGRSFAVVENGVRGPDALVPKRTDGLNIVLVGRFNSLKGQDILLKALALLTECNLKLVHVRFVGGVYKNQSWHLDSVVRLCDSLGLNSVVQFFDFQDDVSEHYQWANLVVVPSLMVEPFGLVAIEGMSYGCAVVAADHGGLSDIVDDGVTGRKFPPGDVSLLADCVQSYIDDLPLLGAHARAARSKYLDLYTEDRFLKQISRFVLTK